MGHLYALIALAVLAGPLAASFEPRVHFWTHWPAAGAALALSGALYLFWDAAVVRRGEWEFNPKFTGTFRLFGLPLGEYLFFLAVPYACLFLFEVVLAFARSTVWWPMEAPALLGAAVIFALAAWLVRARSYTALALASVAVFLAALAAVDPALAGRSEFWVWFGVCFVAFVVVDGTYTALPTIWYNPKAVTGVRIGPIPLEDFFYNFSYLGLTLCFYLLFERWFGTTAP